MEKPYKSSGSFVSLIFLGCLITFMANNPIGINNLVIDNPALKTTYVSMGLILVALLSIVLAKGNTVHLEESMHRIEAKLDEILECCDDVFQNK